MSTKERLKLIMRTSVVGIGVNVFLALFKVIVGTLSNSIAIVLDGVNNFADAGSSLITIIGTALAGKPADKKHPFGYGRVEYLSATVISLIVLYAGVTSFVESVKKIFHPDIPNYSLPSMVIIAVAVIIKIILGRYVKAKGNEYNSDSLVNSGEDATLDSVISAATLLAALIYTFTKFSVESYLGAIISVVIIKSGIEMLRDTISKILGEGFSYELAVNIKRTVTSFPDVHGAYDLVLNNYGPDNYNGSIHIEIPDSYTADKIDTLTRKIQAKILEDYNVLLTAISVYSYNDSNEEVSVIRKKIIKAVKDTQYALQMHGLYIDKENMIIRFDVVISFDAPDRKEIFLSVIKKIKDEFPDYKIIGAIDLDYSELD